MTSDTSVPCGPVTDPTPIFELFRGSWGSAILTAAVAHFDVFGRLADRPATIAELQQELGLEERPTIVLTTALRAMGLLVAGPFGHLTLTEQALEHLVRGAEFDVGDYLGLSAGTAEVLNLVERLRTNQPAGLNPDDHGAAFIYRDGIKSAMETAELAEHFTVALAGRARNVAPVLAANVPLHGARTLLDPGGGTGIYSLEFLKVNPGLRAIILDRPEVLRVAERYVVKDQLTDRIDLRSGDMFADELPKSDVVLLSNVLHDWDVPACRTLIRRCAEALNPGGRLILHDVLLNDALDGPLPVALYSAALFSLTEGRAYSLREYCTWLQEAGLSADPPIPTLIHCHAIVARRTNEPAG